MDGEERTNPVPIVRHRAGQSLFESEEPAFQEYRRRWERQPREFDAGDFPLFVDIETTNACNLDCTFCFSAVKGRSRQERGFLDPELFRKIIDEGQENGLYGVKLNIRGEPLLHRELPTFARYAVEAGLVDVYFNTNATLLDEEKARRLIGSGLSRITFSVEGFTKEVYERFRRGATFETVKRNIERFHALRQELGSPTPRIRISSVLLPEIADVLDEYIGFWQPYADEISTNDMMQYGEAAAPNKGVASSWACNQLWQRMSIWWDGTIYCCNENYSGELVLGNIRETTLREAWHSARHDEIRALHQRGEAHHIESCSDCRFRDLQIEQRKKDGRDM